MFRAFDPESDRLVAVKRFQLDVPPERMHELVADLDRLVAAELTHPATAAPIAAGLCGTAAFLGMEYVSGDSLDLALRDYGAAPPPDALRVAAQLASALDFAAVVGILHGALHPRDVLLSSDDTRITGLGVAASVERIGVRPPIRRPYTAPERIAGRAWDRRADVFSLAALVYEMLYGKRVVGTGDSVKAAVTHLPGGDVTAIGDVFARALAEEPDARFGTALEFVEALKTAFVESAPEKPAIGNAALPPLGSPAAGPETQATATVPVVSSPRLPLDGDEEPESPDTWAETERTQFDQPDLPDGPDRFDPRHRPDQPDLPDRPDRPDQQEPRDEPGVAPLFAPAPDVAPVPSAPLDEVAASAPVENIDPPAAAPADPSDFEIRAAEERRYDDVSAAPAIVSDETGGYDATPPPASGIGYDNIAPRNGTPPEFLAGAIERSRSAIWPLVLALGVGLAVGFAGGYGIGSRDRSAAASAVAAAQTPGSKPADPAARDTTDVAVNDSQPRQAKPVETKPPEPPAAAESRSATPSAPGPGAPAADARPAEVKGSLLVHSTPSGAHVFVDGREYGTTPLPVRELSRGAHRVRIVRDGYATIERRVVLTSSRPSRTLSVPLTRSGPSRAATSGRDVDSTAVRPSTPSTIGRFVGALTVDSRPTGARVLIDGRFVGTTPLQIPEVTAGSHAVVLEHDGYRRWSAAVRVVASEKNRVTASLEK